MGWLMEEGSGMKVFLFVLKWNIFVCWWNWFSKEWEIDDVVGNKKSRFWCFWVGDRS